MKNKTLIVIGYVFLAWVMGCVAAVIVINNKPTSAFWVVPTVSLALFGAISCVILAMNKAIGDWRD